MRHLKYAVQMSQHAPMVIVYQEVRFVMAIMIVRMGLMSHVQKYVNQWNSAVEMVNVY